METKFPLSICVHPLLELSQLTGLSAALGPSTLPESGSSTRPGSDILDSDKYSMVLDKSNIILLGPTGSGQSHLLAPKTLNNNEDERMVNSASKMCSG